MRMDKDSIRIVLILCGGLPLLFFWHTKWIHAALLVYLITTLLFFVVLAGDYPPFATRWFWKSMIPITVIHSGIVAGLTWLDLNVPYINETPRALYGFAVIILAFEWRISLRIIEGNEPAEPAMAGGAPNARR